MKTDSILCPDANGTHRMAYAEWGTPSDKPAVVCVHGLTRNGRDFDWLAGALSKAGRHVLCPTMPGRGLSDDFTGHSEQYNYGQYISDINVLLKAKNITRVDWVGTSMGGLIGMMMAAAPENPIQKMVLNDVGPYLPLAALQRISSYVAMQVEFADAAQLERHIRQIYAPFGITRDADWQQLASTSSRTLPNGKLTLAHDPAIAASFKTLEKDVDLWPVYDAIKCPTLVLRGETSDVLSASIADEMTRRGPQARLITYASVGHAPALIDEKQINDIATFFG